MVPRETQMMFQLIAHLNGNVYRIYQLDGYRMYLNVSESIMMAWRACGNYEPHKHQLMKNTLRPGMTFIDVGANKGDFTLLAASRVGPQGRVLAFEPHPDNTYWLRQSIALNRFTNITLVEAALSNSNGRENLFEGSGSGQHSLLKQADGQRAWCVNTYRLDDYLAAEGIDQMDAIKIDVEGAEWQVLEGARGTLQRCKPVVYLDVHQLPRQQYAEIFALFHGLGYTISHSSSPMEILTTLPETAADLFLRMR